MDPTYDASEEGGLYDTDSDCARGIGGCMEAQGGVDGGSSTARRYRRI